MKYQKVISGDYKELSENNTRIKDIIRKKYGRFDIEIIERIHDFTKIEYSSLIDIIEEGKESQHDIEEYIKLSIEINTSIDYLIGLTDEEEPYKRNFINI